MTHRQWCALAALVVLAPGILPAQQQRAYPRWYLSGAGEYGRAMGDAADYVRDGGGISAYGAWRLGRTTPFTLRVSGNVLIYGSRTDTYPVVPGLDVDVTTMNTIAGFGIGPQFVAGGPGLSAYVFATAGTTYIATTSEVSGGSGDVTTQIEDWAPAAEGGGGLLIRLSRVLDLDLGARYRYTGEVTYLPRGELQLVGGSYVLNPITSEVSLMLYHVGLTVKLGGIRPRDEHDDDHDQEQDDKERPS